jgi:predicted DNA-binding transcriptional regulator YafY
MPRPATRVLAVLELLQTHGTISGAHMAERLGINRRTLRRYVAALEEMGIPITAERGRDGGYSLVPGFKLPPMMFTDDEALALSVGLLAARGLGLAEAGPAVASAQAKLERIMPGQLRQRVRAVGETVQLDLSSSPAVRDNMTLLALSTAAQKRQRVRLQYRSAEKTESERNFDPYGLVRRSGCWYVAGMCHLRGGIRTFRLDRILAVVPLPQSFARPEHFDAKAHLAHAIATLPRACAVEVMLKTDLHTARAHLNNAIGVLEQCEDGVLMRNQSEDLDWFARQLAALPFGFTVLHPHELKKAVQACAQRLLQQID